MSSPMKMFASDSVVCIHYYTVNPACLKGFELSASNPRPLPGMFGAIPMSTTSRRWVRCIGDIASYTLAWAHFCDEKPVKNMAGRWAGLVFTCSLPLCCVYAPQIYIRICIMQLAMVHYQGKKCSWSGGGGCKTRVRKIKTDSSMWG